MAQSGKDWSNFALYTDPYIRKLHKEVDKVLSKEQKAAYHPDDFAHFDSLHYCSHEWLKSLLDTHFQGRGLKALELCSGAGCTARFIAARYPATITALDLTETLNNVHRRINRLCGIDNIAVVRGDAADFNHAEVGVNGDCDLVYSILALLHIENRAGVYRMANRALKLQGRFFLEDFTIQSPIPEDEDDIAACKEIRFCSKVSTAENCRLLERAGFQVEQYTQRTREWSVFVFDRAEATLQNRENLLREYGTEYFDPYFNCTVLNSLKLYHDLGLSFAEVKAKYPLLRAQVGDEFLQKWTQATPQKYGGSYILATKVQNIE